MAGTVTLTDKKIGTMRKLTFDWLSTVGGVASYTMTAPVRGVMYRQVIIPDSGGTQPSTGYDVFVRDADGVDIMGGRGVNLSNTTARDIVLGTSGEYAPVAVEDVLALSVADAGAAKGGNVILYVR